MIDMTEPGDYDTKAGHERRICTGCGSEKWVRWMTSADIPDRSDARPGAYCDDCRDRLGIDD